MKALVRISLIILITLSIFGAIPFTAGANGAENVNKLQTYTKSIVQLAEKGEMERADEAFLQLKNEWTPQKTSIKNDSLYAYTKIQSSIAALSLSFLNDDAKKAAGNARELNTILADYQSGSLQPPSAKPKSMSLSNYILLLKETENKITSGNLDQANIKAVSLQGKWLSVEGDVVSQSKSVYNRSEKRLLLIKEYIENGNPEKATELVNQMITDLQPLTEHSYGWLDAALIPLREGLEALLVIGALLSITKKTSAKRESGWIWTGTIAGLCTSILFGVLVSVLLNSITFGKNNFLINGISGLLASVMLLYVSYWLHRNSNIKKWNQYIKGKTNQALGKGKKAAFFFISYLAILREGSETVIFLIGMADKMPYTQLVAGIAVGFLLLSIIGFVMLKLGARLPLKPFFIVSSLIVLYMCLKFMGSGIHSLQLSGLIPARSEDYLISSDIFGIYPSWISTIPQFIILAAAISLPLIKSIKEKKEISA
ncbi:FTR1 family iron permease [Falsibacillus pallidus]|uniref:High-affinity iron transporter n=1 Tax=Falsibacillus pallidus TaxID=493781 RepID=A0A370GRH4_9BACI|nr:FTR1 family protein [Falsibacillus pallidus]RDI45920.1 high-affinity iron transporter [Falsibacillus pallidus]